LLKAVTELANRTAATGGAPPAPPASGGGQP
jgi:hypothetical protein